MGVPVLDDKWEKCRSCSTRYMILYRSVIRKQQLNTIIAGPTRKGKINDRLRIQVSRIFRLLRVQPMCTPRKARPLPKLRVWSDHGWVLFFSMRGACDRWCKYYNGWSYIIYREFQKRKAMWECALCVKYVYITALTVLFQRHTWREDTTYSNEGAAGGSYLSSLCYVCTATMALLATLSHASQRERKEEKRQKQKKRMTGGSKKKTGSRQWRSKTTW